MPALLAGTSRADSAAQFLTVLFAFIFVLALTLVGTRLIGNYQKQQSFSKNFESIEGFKLAGNKYLQLIRIGERYFVLAVGKDEVTVVTEVAASELDFEKSSGFMQDGFNRILSRARGKLQNKGGKTDDEG